jgi:pimeloyl-ACP methyl ester carboxylesterase
MRDKNKRIGRKRWLIALGLVVLIFILVSLVTTKLVYDAQFRRHDRPDETIHANLRYIDIERDYPRSIVHFTSGKNTLQGYFYGDRSARALMVVAHGLGGGADSYLSQIRHFVDSGFLVFAYDCTGSYDSEGTSTKGFPQSVLDLHAALTYLESQPSLASLPRLLFGHSWGGYAVATVLTYGHDIKAVVSVSGANSAMDIIIEQAKQMMGSVAYTQYPFLWLYQHMLFGKAASLDAVTAINDANIPVLIIHGIEDELVVYDGSAVIAFKDKISNPYVRYITTTQKGRNGHNNLFRTDEAVSYVEQVNKEYRALYDAYETQIPYEVKKKYYASINRFKIHALQPSLMEEIDAFLDSALL